MRFDFQSGAASGWGESDPRFAFAASSAQRFSDIEEIEEMNGRLLAYTRTIIAQNECGEYFWFYFRSDAPL